METASLWPGVEPETPPSFKVHSQAMSPSWDFRRATLLLSVPVSVDSTHPSWMSTQAGKRGQGGPQAPGEALLTAEQGCTSGQLGPMHTRPHQPPGGQAARRPESRGATNRHGPHGSGAGSSGRPLRGISGAGGNRSGDPATVPRCHRLGLRELPPGFLGHLRGLLVRSRQREDSQDPFFPRPCCRWALVCWVHIKTGSARHVIQESPFPDLF